MAVRLSLGVAVAHVVLAGLVIADLAPVVAGDLLAALLVVTLSVLAHELAHAVVARRSGFRVESVRVSLYGGRTSYVGAPAPPHITLRIAAAGPALSAVLACACVAAGAAWPAGGGLLAFGAWVNVANAIVNLVPLPSLDGGQIGRALVESVRRPTG